MSEPIIPCEGHLREVNGEMETEAAWRNTPEGFSMDIEINHPEASLVMGCLVEIFRAYGGTNYLEMRAKHKEDGEEYVVTIQRAKGETPAAKADRYRELATMLTVSLDSVYEAATGRKRREGGSLFDDCNEACLAIRALKKGERG